MTGSRRAYAWVPACVLAAVVLLAACAWAGATSAVHRRATATVHRTEARCNRPAVTTAGRGAAVTGQDPPSATWRTRTFRAGGCGALRQVRDLRQHRTRH
ncbi:hypothetical protein ACNTMW_08930 [Planosporangium sp. 12N6]|uniref:hypothetical protein n=1 Tax=Planosporangium spinosum TaxID=3402278 RepID=UPI003CF2025A